jgi:glycosyltransferase involved in cell wall biosynthesis
MLRDLNCGHVCPKCNMPDGTIQVVQKLEPGGIETLALALSSALPGPNAIFSLERDEDALRGGWPSAGASRARIEGFSKNPGVDPSLVFALARRMRALEPRAVITHHIGPLLYAGSAARLARVPRLAHVERDVWHFDAPRRRTLAQLAVNILRPDYVALSQGAAAHQRKLLGINRVTVIPNGVDVTHFAPGDPGAARRKFGLAPDHRWMGSAGRLETVKGHDVLIEAFAQLPDQNLRLAIAGDGSRRQALEQLAATRGVADRVRFLGHCTDIAALLPAFDLFCLPSRAEGLPLSVLEAQAAGVPVVASDVGAVREALCPQASRLAPAGDPAGLAAAIADILARPHLASPRPFIVANFNWEQTVRAYRELIGV